MFRSWLAAIAWWIGCLIVSKSFREEHGRWLRLETLGGNVWMKHPFKVAMMFVIFLAPLAFAP